LDYSIISEYPYYTQRIYGLSSPQTYKNNGFKILPSRTINTNIIRTHWDDILRFMTTIKLKETAASQLFKRLSSYAKDHPLYIASNYQINFLKQYFLRITKNFSMAKKENKKSSQLAKS